MPMLSAQSLALLLVMRIFLFHLLCMAVHHQKEPAKTGCHASWPLFKNLQAFMRFSL